jgi:hypothetical protein
LVLFFTRIGRATRSPLIVVAVYDNGIVGCLTWQRQLLISRGRDAHHPKIGDSILVCYSLASSTDAKNEGGRGYVQLTHSSSSGCTQFLGIIKNRWGRLFAPLASRGGGCFFASPSFRGGRLFAPLASRGEDVFSPHLPLEGEAFCPFRLYRGGCFFCFEIWEKGDLAVFFVLKLEIVHLK